MAQCPTDASGPMAQCPTDAVYIKDSKFRYCCSVKEQEEASNNVGHTAPLAPTVTHWPHREVNEEYAEIRLRTPLDPSRKEHVNGT